MPAPHPPEFRRRAVELARLRQKPVAEIAKDLGISDSCLRNWMSQADIDEGRKEGLSSDEKAELSGCAGRTASSTPATLRDLGVVSVADAAQPPVDHPGL